MTTIVSNLPLSTTNTDSASNTKQFFNTYYQSPVTLSADQIDAVVGFFTSRGFDQTAAVSTASVLLTQAKVENVNVFKILDTLKTLSDVQLSSVVREILNYNRLRISILGYKVDRSDVNHYELRNILA
jgi:hypothetical protein